MRVNTPRHGATHVFEEPLDRLGGHGRGEVAWMKGEDEVCSGIGGVLSESDGFASRLGAYCPGDDCAWVSNFRPCVSGERDELEANVSHSANLPPGIIATVQVNRMKKTTTSNSAFVLTCFRSSGVRETASAVLPCTTIPCRPARASFSKC